MTNEVMVTLSTLEKIIWAIGIIGAIIAPIWTTAVKVVKIQSEFKQSQIDIKNIKDDIKDVKELRSKVEEMQAELRKQKELNKQIYRVLVEAIECIPDKNSEIYRRISDSKKIIESYIIDNM